MELDVFFYVNDKKCYILQRNKGINLQICNFLCTFAKKL